ncbi:MAG: double-cubane-cluster-containing anaerobic reductase [Caldimicrobium sp.]
MMNFEVKADPELWEKIGVDVTRLSKMREVLTDLYKKAFLSQKNRPEGMRYFDEVISNIHTGRIREILQAKEEGRPVVGTFCVFVPEEIIVGLEGVCIGLCGGSQGTIPDAEKVLPKNICPLVKSAYGFRIGRVCPYFQVLDVLYGETTCDAKKKNYELYAEELPTYVMEIPQMKRKVDEELWLKEVKAFKEHMEGVAKRSLTEEALHEGIKIINRKRKALQRLNELRMTENPPISGKDVLLINQISFYDDPVRFAEKVEALCEELEERVKRGEGVSERGAVRVMIAGTPMALPNWKVPNIVENSGGIIVYEESCIGSRYFNNLIPEESKDLESMLLNLTRRYMKINCACFTPNEERIQDILSAYERSKAEGIIYYSLAFCHTYNIEAYKVKRACEERGIPFLFIETDYSPEDVGQLQTRIEAFLEQIRERRS